MKATGHAESRRGSSQIIPNQVLGTLIFIVSETMLFAGMVSGFLIVKSRSIGMWPPPDQARLPVEATAFNTAVLLASGLALFWAHRTLRWDADRAKMLTLTAFGLGAFFVAFQGWEWLQLIAQGLTMTASAHGSFFYLIVGTHAAHAVAALIALFFQWRRMATNRLDVDAFNAAQLFWYFVVGMWPLLYAQVYLA